MAQGSNWLALSGTVLRKPELKQFKKLCVLQVELGGTDHILGTDGEPKALPWYHRVSVLGRAANVHQNLMSGDSVLVHGKLHYRQWTEEEEARASLHIQALKLWPILTGLRDEPFDVDSKGQKRLSAALNQINIVGNLARPAEVTYAHSGEAVTNLKLAVSETYRTREGAKAEATAFVDVEVWRELAEGCALLARGAGLMVQGRLKRVSWRGDDERTHYKLVVEGFFVEILEPPTKS